MFSPNSSRWRIGVLVLGLTAWSTVVAAAPPIFRCPKAKGLCRWQDQAWESYWKVGTSEELIDFRVVGDRVVVLVRGHMSAGRVIVLNDEGETLLLRHLATGRNLAAVIGEGPYGILLCNGAIGSAWCDTWSPEEPSSATPLTPWVPGNCLFPRFSNGKLSCVEDWPEPVLRVGSSRPVSGKLSRTPLSFEGAKWLEDLHPLKGNRFAIRANRKLFLLDEAGHAQQISEGRVDWSEQVAENRVVFAECSISDELTVTRCKLASTSSEGGFTEIWDSDRLWPVDLAVLGEGSYLVQVTNEAENALVLLESEEDEWTSRIVWRDAR